MPSIIGLFGGTFDPPHIGHLILSAEAVSQLGLDRLLWILTPDPPHKQGQLITPLEHRQAMVKLAIRDEPHFEFSSMEIERPGPQYAVDTVKMVADLNPGAGLVYVMGGDSLRELPTWNRPADLVGMLDHVGVFRRPGEPIDLPALEKSIPGLTVKVQYLDAPLLDIAAHEIRLRVSEGRPFRYYLPPAVFAYIMGHNLYGYAPPG
jgi:nicotinate-nucleotide adenylyltransferase